MKSFVRSRAFADETMFLSLLLVFLLDKASRFSFMTMATQIRENEGFDIPM